jgi:hypothetical protein
MRPSAQSLRPRGEKVIPLRYAANKIPPVTRVRSTLVRSSIRTVEQRGFLPAYMGHLPADVREMVLDVVPGNWVEIDVALAHYRAIDKLGLSVSEQLSMGGAVGNNVQGLLVGTLMRLARGVGLTPWSGVGQYVRIWDRLFLGGDLEVEKASEKEAIVTMHGLRLFSVPYFRVAIRGLQQAGLTAIWSYRRVTATELACSSTMLSCRLTWM